MRGMTLYGSIVEVNGVHTFDVIGRWFNDQLVINFFNEMEWEEIDGKEKVTC